MNVTGIGHLIFALLFVVTGGLLLLNVFLKRNRTYPKNYAQKFTLGKVTDRTGFNRWTTITTSYLGWILVFMGLLISRFPSELNVLITFLIIIFVGYLVIFIAGSLRYTK